MGSFGLDMAMDGQSGYGDRVGQRREVLQILEI